MISNPGKTELTDSRVPACSKVTDIYSWVSDSQVADSQVTHSQVTCKAATQLTDSYTVGVCGLLCQPRMLMATMAIIYVATCGREDEQ